MRAATKATSLVMLMLLTGRRVEAQPPACAPAPPNTPLTNAEEIPGFCPYVWASSLATPRGILTVPNGDLLVLERGKEQVTVLWDENANGASDEWERATLAAAPGLNHAVAYSNVTNSLYASSPSTVYRWDYWPGNRTSLGESQVLIRNIPTGGHVTRSLVVNATGHLFVQVGSRSNVDTDTVHTRVHAFDVTSLALGHSLDWNEGEVIAVGLRNEVGLRFDAQGRLWGVENGVDNLNRADLGGDIHNDNPCEELNLLSPAAHNFFGYPYCWSQWLLLQNRSKPVGSQWAQPDFMNDGVHTDEWCENLQNVIPPAYCFKAHVAPLDLLFWDVSGWPEPYNKGLFVGMHGSWNRQPASGYQVVHATLNAAGVPQSDRHFLHADSPTEDRPAGWSHRPVGLAPSRCAGFASPDCLLISSDASGVIIAMAYNGQ